MAKSSKSIEAGGAFVRLFTEDSALRKGLKSAGGMLKSWGAGFAKVGGVVSGLGASVATPLMTAVWAYMNAGEALAKASQRTGVRTEELSNLGYAAEQAGASMEDMTGALSSMRSNIAGAIANSQGAVEALSMVGLSVRQLRGLSPDEQFRVLADQIAKIKDPALQAAAANRIFGGSAEKLLPLLKQGAKGIRSLESEASALGVTMSTEDAAAAEKLRKVLTQLEYALGAIVRNVGAALAPLLTSLATKAVAVASAFGQWLAKNREIFVTGFKIAAVVIAVGTALTALGLAGMALGAVLGGLATGLGVIGTAISLIGTVVSFLVSPLGLVVAAIVGLVTYSGLAGTALDWLRERFSSLAGDATSAFGAIGKALAAGDIGLAAGILWSVIKLEWARGLAYLTETFQSTKVWLLDMWDDIGLQLAMSWIRTVAFLENVWSAFIFNIEDFGRGFLDGMGSAFGLEATMGPKQGREQLDQQMQEREEQAQQQLAELAQQQPRRDAEKAQRAADSQAEIDKAREDLRKAQDDFTSKVREADQLPAASGKSLAELLKGAESLFAGINPTGMASKISSAGSFSAAQVRGLGSVNFEQRIAAATEATARSTKEIAEKPAQKAA